MKKSVITLSGIILSILTFSLPAFSQETFTITTYYPAPFGTYQEMRIHNRMSVGDVNGDGLFDNNDLAVDSANQPLAHSLTVGNNISIGTNAPLYPLDIQRTYSPDPGRYVGIHTQGSIFAEYPGDIGLVLHNTAANGEAWGLTSVSSNTPEGRLMIKYNPPGIAWQDPGNNISYEWLTIHKNGYVGIGHTSPAAKLHVRGEVKVWNTGLGGNELACTSGSNGTEGAIRYNTTAQQLQYCNGTVWLPIGNLPAVDSYVGNGSGGCHKCHHCPSNVDQKITLGFRPRTIIITKKNLQFTKNRTMSGWTAFQEGAGNWGDGKAQYNDTIHILDDGFKVKGDANDDKTTYHYTAWP